MGECPPEGEEASTKKSSQKKEKVKTECGEDTTKKAAQKQDKSTTDCEEESTKKEKVAEKQAKSKTECEEKSTKTAAERPKTDCEDESTKKAAQKQEKPTTECGVEKKTKKIVSKPIKPKTSEAAKHASYSAPVFEFPHILRIIGPKHIKIMMNFVPTAIFYSLTSLILLTYMAEWRTVLQYLPYYNGKYVEEKTESTKENEEEET